MFTSITMLSKSGGVEYTKFILKIITIVLGDNPGLEAGTERGERERESSLESKMTGGDLCEILASRHCCRYSPG